MNSDTEGRMVFNYCYFISIGSVIKVDLIKGHMPLFYMESYFVNIIYPIEFDSKVKSC